MLKKNYFLMIASLLPALFFASCDDSADEIIIDPEVSITFTATPDTVMAGENVTLDWNVISPEDLDIITLMVDGTTLVSKEDGFTNDGADNGSFTYTTNDSDAGSTLSFELTATDNDGNTATEFMDVMVMSPGLEIYTTVLLAAPTADDISETFFSASTGLRYSIVEIINANNSNIIDFGYYYGATNNASIASPSVYPSAVRNLSSLWGSGATLNTTEFKSATSADYDNSESITDLGVIFDTNSSAGSSQVTQLDTGETFIFTTSAGQRGIFRVADIVGTDGSDGRIELEIKVAPM